MDDKLSNSSDHELLENAYREWLSGDWQALSKLDIETIRQHSDRAELALLSAAGKIQTKQINEAHTCMLQAKRWGASKDSIAKILISGIQTNLGRAALLTREKEKADFFFKNHGRYYNPSAFLKIDTQEYAQNQRIQVFLSEKLKRCYDQKDHAFVKGVAQACIESNDIYEFIDWVLENKLLEKENIKYLFLELSDYFIQKKDRLTAQNFLEISKKFDEGNDVNFISKIIIKMIDNGFSRIASDVFMEASISNKIPILDNKYKSVIESNYKKIRMAMDKSEQHGQDLLLTYLQNNLKTIKSNFSQPPVIIEIGTTREQVPGQGSTKQFAEFCKNNGFHFITVDMDPHNTQTAAKMFREMQTEFQAINMAGENYLREYDGFFDFVFLDAYDFDHGQHSEIRQQRYIKYMGGKIDESQCHKMHLDCAESIVKKLYKGGLVCFDDTWLEDGKWTAKGTTAMPFLLDNGFYVLEKRNRAALLCRNGESFA